jgi:uncharacterized membrane protein YuzA (DUF378 family)
VKAVTLIAVVLLIIGGINWGLVGVFDYNLVDSLFGEGTTLSRIIYGLVGLAAIWKIVALVTTAPTEARRE